MREPHNSYENTPQILLSLRSGYHLTIDRGIKETSLLEHNLKDYMIQYMTYDFDYLSKYMENTTEVLHC